MKSALIRITLISFLLVLFIPNSLFAETKTFIKEYTYQASEDDSRNSSRTIALREVKRLLLEELGTYLESVTEVQNFQLTKDQIVTLTAGIVQTEIVDEKWDGHTYWLRARVAADSDSVIKNIDALRSDREKTKELEEVRKRSDEQLREIERLRKELVTAKDESRAKKKAAYDDTISSLKAIEWVEKGIALGRAGDHNNAIESFTKAIELNPIYAVSYNNRGIGYGRIGNHERAIEDFTKAIELNPIYADAYNNRGVAYGRTGNQRQAIEDYGKAIELNLKYSLAYNNRGIAYGRLGNYKLAIEDFTKTIELNPIYADAYNNRGVAYGNLGKHRQALKDFDKAIEINPKYAHAYYGRGIAYGKLGNHKQAIEDTKTAARLGEKRAQDFLRRKGIDW